nr:MerR family transcriptional regulator [Agrobacterium sp. a22-2]
MPNEPVAIADMANLFGVTHRTLHFYEEKGLLSASRVGLMRVYFHKDIVRMALINACREVGMPVAIIQDLLEELAATVSQEQADEIFRDSLTVRKRELTSGLSTIRRQMQQINGLLAQDDNEPSAPRVDGRDAVSLSALERRCLELMAEGYAPMRLARALQLKNEEITALENEIIRKFDANNRFQAVAKAVLMGVVAS